MHISRILQNIFLFLSLNITVLQPSFVYAQNTITKEISNTINGSTSIFTTTQANTNIILSHSYTSVAVKIHKSPTPPIILISNDKGKNWHMLNFNTDSKTDNNENRNSEFLYSDLLFLNKDTESKNFMFTTKLGDSTKKTQFEFSFFKDDKYFTASMAPIDNSYNLGYTRDEWFFSENNIIRREDWGANETYRYTTKTEQNTKNNTPNPSHPLSNRAKTCNKTIKNNPQDFKKSRIIYSDTNGKLKWPYQYSPTIRKIIIHHTGTNNATYEGYSDEEIMRAIYKYHTNIKHWGDIGYNFVISPHGKIFEGKAGGDFIIGGHTYCANTQTIGISVMGNYETDHINDLQLQALKKLVTALSKKYNITPQHKSTFLGKYTYDLVGHKDYGKTLCPGKNLYKYLDILRKYTPHISQPSSIPTPPRSTPLYTYINPASLIPHPTIGDKYKTKKTIRSQKMRQSQYNTITPPKRNIRIKLSYSGPFIQVKGHNMSISIQYKNNIDTKIKKRRVVISTQIDHNNKKHLVINGKQANIIRISNENASEPLEIASWFRPLAWDKLKNDNLFLGTLEIRIINNNLVVINELPIEDYIKGIAEVSNTAPIEKQKAIAVIARTYAQFYMDSKHKKFPDMPYDGDDTPEAFQKYRGYGYQLRSPLFVQAVDNTKSQVITYHGEIIKTPFFSESAGKTFSAKEKWGWTHTPYLQSVNDIFCKNGHGTLKGHGVGLSGCGAETMANLGHSYKEIIKYYYKGVEIQ